MLTTQSFMLLGNFQVNDDMLQNIYVYKLTKSKWTNQIKGNLGKVRKVIRRNMWTIVTATTQDNNNNTTTTAQKQKRKEIDKQI